MDKDFSAAAAVKKDLKEALALRDFLYEHPELPYHELKSSAEIVRILGKHRYEVEYPFMEKELGYGSAFRAILKNGCGPSVAVMVEYDALPEIGHGCGHNLHGALSVLAGMALARLRDKFSGTVYVIGTPAEEENGAKVLMADKGVFDGMSLAVMMHSWSGGESQPDMDVLSLRCYVVEFFGKSAHAVARPWEGCSALATARKFIDLIDARRECFTKDVHVNCVILDGGRAPSMIPDYAKIRMEFRTDSMSKLEKMDRIIRNCADGAALAMDCRVTLKPGLLDFRDMVRVKPLEDEAATLFRKYDFKVRSVASPSGSSDVGNVSYRCPAIQPLISISDKAYALHTEQMRNATMTDQASEALEKGACIISELALRVFNDEKFCAEATRDFTEKRSEKLEGKE